MINFVQVQAAVQDHYLNKTNICKIVIENREQSDQRISSKEDYESDQFVTVLHHRATGTFWTVQRRS